jgi:hypothetical protein
MDYVGSLDSSHDLQPIYAKSFVNRLHLVLQISKIPLKILRLRHFCVYSLGTKHALNICARKLGPIFEQHI